LREDRARKGSEHGCIISVFADKARKNCTWLNYAFFFADKAKIEQYMVKIAHSFSVLAYRGRKGPCMAKKNNCALILCPSLQSIRLDSL
jgi:hypothetical protein